MILRRASSRARRGAMFLTAGNLATAIMILARNILIARLISVEDFGIASTFALAVTLIETGTNIALDRLVVQHERGGQRRFLAALHTVQIIRGAIGALVILLMAPAFAWLMGVPDLAWAYQLLALVPLIRCLAHLDMFRAQRAMSFVRHQCAMLTSNLCALAAAWPLAIWLGDYRIMLFAVMIQQAIYVAVSHLMASSPFRVRWEREDARHSLVFGVPLLLNGLIMFATLNGDQMLVGSFLGMETLGWFAVAYALTLVPATILANTLQSLLLPGLSRLREDPSGFAAQARNTLAVCFALACLFGVAMVSIGPIAIELLFGPRYADAAVVLPWLAVVQALRVAKAGPAIVAIAKGQTRDPLIANLPRLMMIPIAVLWLSQGGGIMAVVLPALVGECAALLAGVALLAWRGVLTWPSPPGALRHG